MQMYATSTAQPDPVRQMGQFLSEEIADKANRWLGRNSCRWSHPAYDKAFAEADAELDPVRRAALFIRMNDILVQDHAVIPLLARTRVVAIAKSLVAAISVWDLDMAYLRDWHREG
jgi:peptide/nickel transport system substrate-binding protein